MKTVITVAVMLIAATSAGGKPRVEYRDFSQKAPEYRPLENLRLAATDVTYQGQETVTAAGTSYSASKYSVRAIINVETFCAITVQGYERVAAYFDVFIADDNDQTVRDAYLRTIYELWNRKEIYSGENFFDFHVKDNAYALTTMPDLVNIKAYYFIWVNGRVVKVSFKGFEDQSKGGFGIMDTFTANNLRIKIGDAEFVAYEFPLTAQKRFLKLYRGGFFGPVKTA